MNKPFISIRRMNRHLKLADIYKGANPQQAIEKLEQLKSVVPSSVLADKKLAEVYYMNNRLIKHLRHMPVYPFV